MQVLSVETALSIQSHPDKELAERLHAQQPDVSSWTFQLCFLSLHTFGVRHHMFCDCVEQVKSQGGLQIFHY